MVSRGFPWRAPMLKRHHPRPGVPFGSFFGSMINVEHGMDCEGGEDG
jgi:hypothetical protein